MECYGPRPSWLVQLPVQGQERERREAGPRPVPPEAAVPQPQPSCSALPAPRLPALPLIAASSQPAAAYKQIFVLSFFFCHLALCWYFKLAFGKQPYKILEENKDG